MQELLLTVGQEVSVVLGDGSVAVGFIKEVTKEPDITPKQGVRYGERGDVHIRVIVNEVREFTEADAQQLKGDTPWVTQGDY